MLIAFSVLAKSAAALLVSRHLIEIPASWRIYASAYWDEGVIFDLDESVGATTPFDDGLKVWIRPASKHDWQVIYKSDQLVLIFLFSFSNADSLKGLQGNF